MPRAPAKPRPICPGCGRHCARHHCRACGYESADPGAPIPTARELADGITTGGGWNGVDIGAYARAVLADLKAGE